MTPSEFKILQAKTGLDTINIAKHLGCSESAARKYGTGFLPVPGRIAEEIRILAAQGNQAVKRVDHQDARVAAGIRYMLSEMYPQWINSDTDGQLPGMPRP